MGKSSSSVKKKRSGVSSLSRKRKRSKSRMRRSNKFKKLRDRDDSVSYSSGSDDLRTSVSVSSSSSEDGHRSKRSRSRMRKDLKSRRKRSLRRSSSRERYEESRPVKKRKGSKKTDKRKKKKKSKREVSLSSASSGSSGESEVEKSRSGFDRKGKDRRPLEMVKSGSKRRRSRSRSWSSYSRCSESSGYRSEEKLTGEVNPRRLKSVITVLREGSEERWMDEDVHKDEMVYDYDDCPPCRSNDSNDGASKRGLVRNSRVASETKRYAEDEKREEPFISGNVSESDKDREGQYASEMNNAVKETNNEDSGGVDSTSSYDLESILRQKALENLKTFRKGTQLDAIAKALVNQKDMNKCDAKTPTTTKGGDPRVIGGRSPVAEKNSTPAVSKGSTGVNKDNKESLSTKDDAVHTPDQAAVASSPNGNVSITVKSMSSKSRLVSLSPRQELSKTCTNKNDAVHTPNQVAVASNPNKNVSATVKSVSSKPRLVSLSSVSSKPRLVSISPRQELSKTCTNTNDAVHTPDQVAVASNPNKNVSATVKSVSSKPRLVSLSSVSSKPRLVSLSSRQELSKTCTNKKHVAELQEPPQTSNSAVETARTAISLPGNSNGEEANKASASDDPSTCPKSVSGGVSSNNLQEEATEDSQFQQKTMSVMRGGEMVEVSYKVYIPKKGPALARRTLKR